VFDFFDVEHQIVGCSDFLRVDDDGNREDY